MRLTLHLLVHGVRNEEFQCIENSPKQPRTANPFLPADELVKADHAAAVYVNIVKVLFACDYAPFQEVPAEAATSDEHTNNTCEPILSGREDEVNACDCN